MSINIGVRVLLILAGISAVIFYDTSITLISLVIQLKINILGFFIEPFLQWVFGIPLRQAQMVSAWIYLILASLVFWYMLCLGYQALCRIVLAARNSWLIKNRWQKIRLLLLIMLVLIAIAKTLLVFV